MRICHVITKPELGGAQLSTLSILSNLPKDRYDVSIVASSRGMLVPEFRGIRGVKSYFSPFLTRPINPIADIIAFVHIFLIYRRYKFTLVHTHSSKAGIVGRWAAFLYNLTQHWCTVNGLRCTVVHTVHGWPFNDYQNIIKKWVFILLERITARFTAKIICVSKKDIETGLRYKIAPREKFALIRYGIPLAEFRRSSNNNLQKRKELGIDNNDPVVGMISCLKPQKSPIDYIKACIKIYENMPDVNFLLVGDGLLRKKCEKALRLALLGKAKRAGLRASPLNGRFIFAGWRRDISEILDVIDVAVLTSKWEGMPVSIIEALTRGKPAVITDVGGARELVRNNITGYITRPGSFEETAASVLRILKDKASFLEMSKRASLSIDDSFDLVNMINKLDELYRSLA